MPSIIKLESQIFYDNSSVSMLPIRVHSAISGKVVPAPPGTPTSTDGTPAIRWYH